MNIETQTPPIRVLVAGLKSLIKDDYTSIRAEKAEIRNLQRSFGPGGAASLQSRLVYHRLDARARLLVYGLLRGRTWEQIESKHTEMPAYLKYAIQRVWKTAHDATLKETGESLPVPEVIQSFLA